MNCTVLDHDKNAGHRISDIGSVLRQHNDILRSKVQQMDKATDVFNTGLKYVLFNGGQLGLTICCELMNLTTFIHAAQDG